MPTRVLRCLTLSFLLLLAAAAAQGQLRANGDGSFADVDRGLTWVADGEYAVTAGLSDTVLMPRARALQILAAMNAGEVESFGRSDWRLPTERELRHLVEVELVRPGAPAAGKDRELFRAWLAALRAPARTAPHAGAPAADLVLLWPVSGSSVLPGFSQVALLATNSLRLKNEAAVTSGDVVVNDASSGPTLYTGFELACDPQVATAAGFALKADSIRIDTNAVIASNVVYNQLVNQGTITGNLSTPLSLPVFSLLPPFFAHPPAPGAQNVTVAAGGSDLLAAGDYGDVVIGAGATLVLSGGTYNVRSIAAGAAAKLLFQAPSEVRVEGRFLSAKDAVIGPENGSGIAAHQLVFYVAGINGLDGGLNSTPLAAEVGPNNLLAANFYVPNGTFRLRQGARATGAFLGRDVLVETRARVALDSFFFNEAPQPADDSATVAAGGTVSVLDSAATSVLANDSDPNGDVLTVDTTPVSGPSHGSLTLHADGTFSYTHDGSATVSDSFVYRVCDNGAPVLCATATVSITVVHTIQVTIIPFGLGSGSVTSTPAGIDCGSTCTATFVGPAPIVLTAQAFGTSVFGGFSGDADCADGILTPDGDKRCYARFDASAVPAILTVSLAGTGAGRVFSAPAGIDCPGTCSAGFPVPTRVELTPVAAAGSRFSGWSGDPGCAGGVIDLFADTSCIATFDLIPPPPPSFTLTLVFLGGGSGTVTSNPPGVLCEANCSTAFPQGSAVTLFIRPLETSTFDGWGGDCSGTAPSTLVTLDSNKVCTVTLSP